jgi:Zn-dependent metalloprotease
MRRFGGFAVGTALAVLIGGGVVVVNGSGPSSTLTGAFTPGDGAAPPAAVAAPPAPARQSTRSPGPATSTAAPKLSRRPARADVLRDARTAVSKHRREILGTAGERYRPGDVSVDPDGTRHVRFSRTYRRLEVIGGDFVLHAGPRGEFRAATVAQRLPIAVDTDPGVDARTATGVAVRQFTGERRTTTPTLVVDAVSGPPVLAWRVVIDGTTAGGWPSSLNVIVDADTGAVRRVTDDVRTADGVGHGLQVGDVTLSTTRRPDGTFELIDPARGGNETRDAQQVWSPGPARGAAFVDDDNSWGDGTPADPATLAADVHYGVQQTWDYFLTQHGRNGIRNDGKGVLAYVHAGVKENNAAWNGSCFCMKFGDGSGRYRPFTDIETVGHEMTHGIGEATADLVYAGESGGIDEATADIFGVMTEFHANNPVDPPDYLIGENTFTDGRALRYMDRPLRDGQSPSCWTPGLGKLDVHYSSGVGNKFFYTLAVGSGKSVWGDSPTCNGAPAVTGIGNEKAARIWYRALTTYMVSTTDYTAARLATLKAATDLYGSGSAEYAAVTGAWLAVAVDGSGQAPSQSPQVQGIDDRVDLVGNTVRLQVVATDPQGDPLTFSAYHLPPGISMDASGLITGVLTTVDSDLGIVDVTDPLGNRGSVAFAWDIVAPLTITASDDRTTALGAWVSLQPTISAAVWEKPVLTAVGLPDGLVLSGGHIYGGPTSRGTFPVVLTVTTKHGRTASTSFRWTIGAEPSAPTSVTVTGRLTSAVVSWQPPEFVGMVGISQYTITLLPGDRVSTVDGDRRSVTFTGLTSGAPFSFDVRAVNSSGTGTAARVRLAGSVVTIDKPSAATVDPGASVRVRGRLTRGGSALPGATVRLEELRSDRKTWTAVASLTTGTDGSWSRPVKPAVNTSYRAAFAGGPGVLGSISAKRSVAVRYTVTAKASTTRPAARKKVAVTGSVKPGRANTVVVLQRLVGKRWVKLATARTRSNGSYTFSRSYARGTWKLRVLVPGTAYHAGRASTTLTVVAR